MNKIIIGIYKIISPSNRIYIGQSVDIKKRWVNYKALNHCNEQKKLYNSFLKYGVESHVFEIIHECDLGELNFWEAYYGELFDATNSETGLNIRECGGSKGRQSQDTKDKIGDAHRGKSKSEEHIKKLVESHLGQVAWNKGLKLPDFSERMMGEKNPMFGKRGKDCHNYGRKDSEEVRMKKSKSRKGRKLTSESIVKREETKRMIRQERLMMIF